MKIRLLILPALFLFALAQIGSAQVDSQAVLSAKFGRLPLGNLLMHVDSFVQYLERNPQMRGSIVIFPGKTPLDQKLRFDSRFAHAIRNRIYQTNDFDESRIKIFKGEPKDEFEVNLWAIPPGAELPLTIVEDLTEPVFDLSEPFVFGGEDNEDIYPDFAPKMYAKLLRDNSNLRGHIVIFNRSKKEGRSEAARWLKMFADDFQVPADRLKIFFARNNGRPDIEFWIVPRK